MRKSSKLLGSYVTTGSPLHRVDTRAKAIALVALVVAVLAAGPGMVAVLAAVLGVALYASGMTPGTVARGVRPAVVVLVVCLLACSFVPDGTGDVILAGGLGVSGAGVLRGVTLALRIVEVVGFALVVSATTTGPELADATCRLLRPLARLGVEVSGAGVVVAVALRFVPIIGEEFCRVRRAQQARGVRFGEGPLLRRIRLWCSLLPPTAAALSRRRRELPAVLRARCYGSPAQATEHVPLGALSWAVMATALMLAVLACVVQ